MNKKNRDTADIETLSFTFMRFHIEPSMNLLKWNSWRLLRTRWRHVAVSMYLQLNMLRGHTLYCRKGPQNLRVFIIPPCSPPPPVSVYLKSTIEIIIIWRGVPTSRCLPLARIHDEQSHHSHSHENGHGGTSPFLHAIIFTCAHPNHRQYHSSYYQSCLLWVMMTLVMTMVTHTWHQVSSFLSSFPLTTQHYNHNARWYHPHHYHQ